MQTVDIETFCFQLWLVPTAVRLHSDGMTLTLRFDRGCSWRNSDAGVRVLCEIAGKKRAGATRSVRRRPDRCMVVPYKCYALRGDDRPRGIQVTYCW